MKGVISRVRMPLAGALVVACLASCGSEEEGEVPVQEGLPERVEAPAWITKPHDRWPQMVLTNRAEFAGHSSLGGASGFLARNSRGDVFYATAKHLLGVNGSVQPEIAEQRLDGVLKSWIVFPRTKESEGVELAGLAGSAANDQGSDWLLLRLKDSKSSTRPAEPLRLRKDPVKVGEKVFLIGVPYAENDRAQNVYLGKVTTRELGDRFRYDLDPPVDLRGFSGAPIIDVRGQVVGVMTVWFDPKMRGNLYLEAGAEDAASVYQRLETATP